MKVTAASAIELIKECIGDDQDFCTARNFKTSTRKSSTVQFTINILSLDLLFSIMELEEVENVYFHPSAAPPKAHVSPTASRYKVYVQFIELI